MTALSPAESSAGASGKRKRTNPGRSSRRIARKETLDDPDRPQPRPSKPSLQRQEKKKTAAPRQTQDPDADRETVVTDHGHAIHPNGEPYYIARIMEFIYAEPSTEADLPISSTTGRKVKAMRVNWFYRPQDISHKKHTDKRCLYASMHSDVNVLSAVRGLCTVRHRAEIPNREFEDYRRREGNFWFARLHDRYIQRNYDVIPVEEVTNVPEKVAEVLREKWKYVVVENGAKKELCQEPRRCTKCGEWCRSSESVRCTECHTDWHMKCVKPPLPRKPTKGYHWACGPCIRNRMKEMKANIIPMFSLKKKSKSHDNDSNSDGTENAYIDRKEEEDEDEDDDEEDLSESGIPESAGPVTRADTPFDSLLESNKPINEGKFASKLWPYRYLGIHCKVEDVLDDQDRIYPRAASRLGPRHQAIVSEWPGRPVEYIDRRTPLFNIEKLDKRLKKNRAVLAAAAAASKEISMSKEGTATPDDTVSVQTSNLEGEERPPWVQERPLGYIVRGEDNFSSDGSGTQLVWKKPATVTDEQIDAYLHDIRLEAVRLGVQPWSTSFLDGAVNALQYTSFNFTKATDLVSTLTPESLWNPLFTSDEVARFEAGVRQYGSELHLVSQVVGTRATAECVRFYYMWKKTARGQEIWGNQQNRKGNRHKTVAATNDVGDVNDSSDDEAFDERKAKALKRAFECKFCGERKCRRWRKASGPLVLGGEDGESILALCDRCADLWRRYAIQYVVPEDLRKTTTEGKPGRKRRTEEETEDPVVEAGKKKRVRKEGGRGGKTVVRRTRAGSIEVLGFPPCAVCGYVEEEEPFVCHVCGLVVHAGCYGASRKNRKGNWACDVCLNDKQPLVSTVPLPQSPRSLLHILPFDVLKFDLLKKYDCVLCCSRESTTPEANGNLPPRQPLKPTANNNWAHVTCALFTPETRFGNAKHLKPVEGIGSIPPSRWTTLCALCETSGGATILCHDCKLPVHVSCALATGFHAGFDIAPVKGSRRDVVSVVSFGGETGVMTAALWCPDHDPIKSIIHPLTEVDPLTQETALTTFVTTYKQADLTLTGTMRKAQLAATATKTSRKPAIQQNFTASPPPSLPDLQKRRTSEISSISNFYPLPEEKIKQCDKCRVRFSPAWWPLRSGADEGRVLCHKCHWIVSPGRDVGNVSSQDAGPKSVVNGLNAGSGVVAI